MRKAIIFPVLGVLTITLLSFAPVPQATQILTGPNGEAIIPSTCNISIADQNFLINTIESFGSGYGYLMYVANNGSVQQFGDVFGTPVDPQVLQSVDMQVPGSNLAQQNAFCGAVLAEKRMFPGDNDKITYKKENLNSLYNQIAPVLMKYGYLPPQ